MFVRLIGALVRAFLMVVMIATPSILIPGVSSDTAQVVTLVAIFAAGLTLFEYASTYPGLIEFRDAPPFNRIRFLSLFMTVFLISVVERGVIAPTTSTQFISSIGTLIGNAIDFPFSPVRLMLLMLPENASVQDIMILRTASGMAYLISLISLAVFLISLRLSGWPTRNGSFNFWVNLPTFDPTAGGDVVERLDRDARVNIALGFTLPFLIPVVVHFGAGLFDPSSLMQAHTLIWSVTAWAFLPASLFMRGIAMGRIAVMISDERARNTAQAQEQGLLTA